MEAPQAVERSTWSRADKRVSNRASHHPSITTASAGISIQPMCQNVLLRHWFHFDRCTGEIGLPLRRDHLRPASGLLTRSALETPLHVWVRSSRTGNSRGKPRWRCMTFESNSVCLYSIADEFQIKAGTRIDLPLWLGEMLSIGWDSESTILQEGSF